MKYFDELKRSMDYLNSIENTVFVGQAVGYAGTGMTNTIKDCNPKKKIELPVFEDTQMGMSIGLSLAGHLPISIYPRWNFLLLATNQIFLCTAEGQEESPTYCRILKGGALSQRNSIFRDML